MTKIKKDKRRKRAPEHYVCNKDFTNAIIDYVSSGDDTPIPDYIGDCFLRMAEGLSQRPNFRGYSWREDMVMDGVENCIKALKNYDPLKPTRSGKPNAFGYFTQIMAFAFLRRIAKENKQRDIKEKIINSSNLNEFMNDNNNPNANSMVEKIRIRRGL